MTCAFRAAVAVGALLLPALATARIVLVQGRNGAYYTNVPEPAGEGLVRPSTRSLPFREVIAQASARYGVAPDLVEAIMACESNFDPEAVSSAGACGLMQLMPETAAHHGLDDPFDVEGNVDAGARHLAQLLRAFGGDRTLAVAAYNAGQGAVERAGGIPAFPETRAYVERVETYLRLKRGDAEESSPVDAEADAPPRRRGPPPRMVRDGSGRVVITNVAPPRTP